jgi:uncharacterized protein YkvS
LSVKINKKDIMRLFINAGHYDDPTTPVYDDPGSVVSDNHGRQIREADICRAVRDAFRQNWSQLLAGIEIIYVPDNLNLRDSINFVNGQASSIDLAIDIHFNSHRDPLISGTEVYYYKNFTIASMFAEKIAKTMQIYNRGPKSDVMSAIGSLGWLRKINCNSILVEICYLSNWSDASKILSVDGQNLAAAGIYYAIKSYQDLNKTLSTIQDKINRLLEIIGQFLPTQRSRLGNANKSMNKRWFESSTGSGGLSMTIAGLSVAGLPVFLSRLADVFHINIPESVISDVINNSVQFIGAAMALWGTLRKVYFSIFPRKS